VVSEVLSKSDEIKLFESIVTGCPEGYVKDILSNIAPQVESAIRSDYGSISMDLEREVADLRAERDKLIAEVKVVQERSAKLQSEYRSAAYTISQAGVLAKQLKAAVAGIRDL
jgi:hypothetical protein